MDGWSDIFPRTEGCPDLHTDGWRHSQYPHHFFFKEKSKDKYLVTGDWNASSMAPMAMIK